jgi:long-chain acyl-CoA synthetase
MQLTRSLIRTRRIFADRIATVFNGRRRNWADFADRVARLAALLHALGVGKGERVAILSHSSDRYIESAFAILWAGGVMTPLSTRANAAELADLLEDCDAEILLIGDDFLSLLPEIRAAAPRLAHVIYLGEQDCPAGLIDYESAVAQAKPIADAGRGGSDLAAIYYTGGTTGRAKGVMLSHANLYANAMQSLTHFRYDERTVYLHAGPLYHLAAGSRIFTNTIIGATHVVIPRFAPDTVLAAIAEHKITMTALVPTMMALLLHHPDFAKTDLSSLDLITYGGSPIPEALIAELLDALPHVRFGQAYGMTELSPACTYLEPRHHSLAPDRRHLLRSAGRPAVGVDIRIVDAEDREVPIGETGEITVAGPIVMQGYWKQPDLTREVLRDGYMHTGDLGAMDAEGFVYVLDRLKDMIISGGENIYSLEIESVIRKHPDVFMCAIIGIPDEKWGEAVHAVVVPRANAALDAAAITAHCRAHLPGFKVPRSVEFRDEMPLSAANKILKSALRRPYWDGQTRNVG